MSNFDNWIVSTKFVSRGLFDEASPENSLSAIKKAVDAGYGLYLDVRSLGDNNIVVFCDETLGRMTGNDGFITHVSLGDISEINLLDSNEKIPTLDEALEVIAGKVPVIINIKSLHEDDEAHASFEKHVWKILSSYKGDYAVASANPYTLEWFKINAPKVKRGQVSSFYKNSNLPFRIRFNYKRLKLNGKVSEPNFIIYKASDLPNRFVKKYKNIPLLAGHVNSSEVYEKLAKVNCNYIFEGFLPKE